MNQELQTRGISRGRKPKNRSKLKIFLIMLIAEIFVLGGIFTYAYFLKQYSKINRLTFEEKAVQNTELSEEKLEEMKGYWNIAIFGVDSTNSSLGKGTNSDVIIIASINQDTGEIRLVSVFRDTYLNVGNNSYRKINAAYNIGGPEQAVKALNQNLDLNITDYITFSWKAVATGINILGGVDVEISKAEFSYINSYITSTVKGTGIGSVQLKSAGLQHLDGVQAVAYARLRYMDNDFARTERQRKIISLAFDKAKTASLDTLNQLLANTLSLVATNLTVDDGWVAISNVGKYTLGETSGFPFARADANLGTKGAVVVPTTLESNVKELHKFLFDDEDYEVSNTVKTISAKISADTGYYKEGENVYHVSTTGGYIQSETTKSTQADETQSSTTAASSTDEDGRLYETDADGETIYLDEEGDEESTTYMTDADGNIIDPPEEEETTTVVSTATIGTLSPSSTTSSSTTSTTSSTTSSTYANPTDTTTTSDGGPGSSNTTTAATVPTTSSTTTTAATTTTTTSSGSGPGSGSTETVANKPE